MLGNISIYMQFPYICFCFADGTPKHMQFGQYIVSNVPSLELFQEESTNKQTAATLRALSSAMLLLQRFSLKIQIIFATLILYLAFEKVHIIAEPIFIVE